MKKFILALILTALFAVSMQSYAADITVGGTTWYSKWIIDESSDMDNALLYGPALSFNFSDDFGLNAVFLMGDYDTEYDSTYRRYDADTSLSYRLNGYFKLFAGIKYMGYRVGSDNLDSYGPACGLSGVLPLIDNFYLLANVSGVYMWSKFTGISENVKTYGYNTSAAIAYYIAPASVTLSLGGRYQYIEYNMEDYDSKSKHKIYGVTASATYTFSF